MSGKSPPQCEALAMICKVISNDVAVSLGGAGGHLEMNAYKPLLIYNISIAQILNDSCHNFLHHLVNEMRPNHQQIQKHLANSLMLVTALNPLIGTIKQAMWHTTPLRKILP